MFHYSIAWKDMRREIKSESGGKLVYGTDHIEGLFYEVWSHDGVLLATDSEQNNPKLTMKMIASLVEEYGFDLSDEVIEDVVEHD